MDKRPPTAEGYSVLRFVPKAAAIAAAKPTSSPRRKRFPDQKGFSGALGSAVPTAGDGSETPEPTSPEVSCMGQIKGRSPARPPVAGKQRRRRRRGPLQRIARISAQLLGFCCARKSPPSSAPAPPPPLGEIATFGGGHYAMSRSGFAADYFSDDSPEMDWEDDDNDDDVGRYQEGDHHHRHGGDVLLAGIWYAGDVEPKKEVNLWKRRPVPPPDLCN
ncbi:unnamed protein product [Spirodela intermedia]|uniref:Uncharacterized protein n=1 Tax=Spirodela intermedia TaxID=51605 RepID=A0A7I8JB91_SPIIN|nr:unnamed protein product [Spirodela intermedia]CAA6666733.1 unnamed protein product [Spirodela intermedia]